MSRSDTTSQYSSTELTIFNGSNISDYSYVPEYYKDAQIGFLVILFFLIIIGNVVVLAAIAVNKERRRSRMNFFIMHLALSDLLTGPLIVLADLITKITVYWYAGNTVCRLHKFAQVVVMYASTYMLVALSLDRLHAVARPLSFSGGRFRVKILVCLAWILSFLFAIPELIMFKVNVSHGGPLCVIEMSQSVWPVYLTLIAVSVFFIPAIIILLCYLAIIVVIFKSSHTIHTGNGRKRNSKDSERLRNDSCQSSGGIIPQAKIRTIKMTFIIVLVFILCWSPYFIFNLCMVFGAINNPGEWAKVTTFIQSLAPLNSAANPVIYGAFSTRICSYLRRSPQSQRAPATVRTCCSHGSPPSRASGGYYTSISETEDFRLSGDIKLTTTQTYVGRVPLVEQTITEADRELLSLHVLGNSTTRN